MTRMTGRGLAVALLIAIDLLGGAKADEQKPPAKPVARPIPIADGEYTFAHRFAEHPSMPSVDMRVRIRQGRVVITNTDASSPFPVGVIVDAPLLWNDTAQAWVIGRTPDDAHVKEVGGCSDGPEVIDLAHRIFWTC